MMFRTASVFCLVVSVALAGCTSSYNRVETGGVARNSVTLDDAGAVLVVMPKDGGYSKKTYPGSGALVARKTDASFSRYARLVDVYQSPYHGFSELRGTIAENNYAYVVIPRISYWVRGNTDWVHTPSQVIIKIAVLDALSGREISSNILEGKGGSSSGDYGVFESDKSPEELTDTLVDDYVDALYGRLLGVAGY